MDMQISIYARETSKSKISSIIKYESACMYVMYIFKIQYIKI